MPPSTDTIDDDSHAEAERGTINRPTNSVTTPTCCPTSVPWPAFVAYLVYMAVFIYARAWANHAYGDMIAIYVGAWNGQSEQWNLIILPYFYTVTITFVVASVWILASCLVMFVRFRMLHRKQLEWSLCCATNTSVYEHPALFGWFYNILPILECWFAICLTVAETIWYYPKFHAAIIRTGGPVKVGPVPILPLVVVAIAAVVPFIIFAVCIRVAARRYVNNRLRPAYVQGEEETNPLIGADSEE